MKFQEYIAKQLVGEAFYELLERIAIALEKIAGIEKPKSEPSKDESKIELVEVTEEQVYAEEKKSARETASTKMKTNELNSQWEEDNLSADELEAIE